VVVVEASVVVDDEVTRVVVVVDVDERDAGVVAQAAADVTTVRITASSLILGFQRTMDETLPVDFANRNIGGRFLNLDRDAP
jgi:hypothetical protein